MWHDELLSCSVRAHRDDSFYSDGMVCRAERRARTNKRSHAGKIVSVESETRVCMVGSARAGGRIRYTLDIR